MLNFPMPENVPRSNYRMPAEWEEHEATWIAWPHNQDDWPGKFGPIPWIFAEVVRHLHVAETVHLLVNDEEQERQATDILLKVGVDMRRVQFFQIATDRVWTRDYAPIFVQSGDGLTLTDWRFNAWAKYADWHRDDAAPSRIQAKLNLPLIQPKWRGQRVVLEGGSIDVNGQGLLLTTEECLLSEVQQRNPGLSREDVEEAFAEYLGIRKVLWLGRGIAGDDTHGHIDDLARFVGPRTIVTVIEDNPNDENYIPLQGNLERLRAMTDVDGQALEIVKLPMPGPVYFDGQRLPASYANFYIANDHVLVPTFNDPNDRVALGVMAECFPDRKVVGVHALDLVWGLGTLHCMTQQQPALKESG